MIVSVAESSPPSAPADLRKDLLLSPSDGLVERMACDIQAPDVGGPDGNPATGGPPSSHKKPTERVSCETLIWKAAGKLQSVADTVAKAAEAHGLLMGLLPHPNLR